MSKEKSQHFAHGKTLTFLEYDYEVLLVIGCMYGQRRLYFHLRVGGRERMLIGVPLSPEQAKAGIPISK